MKVQGNSVSAQPQVQSAQASQASQPKQPVQAQSAQGQGQAAASDLNKDAFVQNQPKHIPLPHPPPPDLGEIFGKKSEVTLDFGDRANASNLSSELSSPTNDLRLAFGEKTETVRQDADGTWRGPEGQPLVEVKLDDGNTAYVDPNTNQYYLTDGKPNILGTVQTLPAQDLPEGSQFSNSHFSDADVGALQKHSDSGSVFPPIKDFPPYRPLPMPEPKFPRDPIEMIPLANRGPIAG